MLYLQLGQYMCEHREGVVGGEDLVGSQRRKDPDPSSCRMGLCPVTGTQGRPEAGVREGFRAGQMPHHVLRNRDLSFTLHVPLSPSLSLSLRQHNIPKSTRLGWM